MRLDEVPDSMLEIPTIVQKIGERYPSDDATQSMIRYLATTSEFIKQTHGPDSPYKQFRYETYEDLLLDLPLSVRRQDLVLPEGFEPMEPQMCFNNSFTLATEYPGELYYVEGWAHTAVIPVRHAWVETHDGLIIDPTWTAIPESTSEHGVYFGVRFSAEFMYRHAREHGVASVLESDWRINFPVLRQGLVLDDRDVVITYDDDWSTT